MTTEGIDLHNALFLLLNNRHRKSDERSWPSSKTLSFQRQWSCVKPFQGLPWESKYSTCHWMSDRKITFTLPGVVNEPRLLSVGFGLLLASICGPAPWLEWSLPCRPGVEAGGEGMIMDWIYDRFPLLSHPLLLLLPCRRRSLSL